MRAHSLIDARWMVAVAVGAGLLVAGPFARASGQSAEAAIAPGVGSEGIVVVLERGSGTAAWIDLESGEVVARRRVGIGPRDLDVGADGRSGVTADTAGRYLTTIDLGAARVVARHALIAEGGASAVLVSDDGTTAWAALQARPAVLEVDLEAGSVRRSWETGSSSVTSLVATPGARKLYAASPDAGGVVVIDRRRGSTSFVATGSGAEGIDISPWGHEVWVANSLDGTVSAIDVAGDSVAATFTSGGEAPARVRFAPSGNRVWVADGASGSIAIFNALSRQQMAEIEIGTAVLDVCFSADGRRAWVSGPRRDVVFEIDVAGRRVLREIAVGDSPGDLAWLPPIARPATGTVATVASAIDDGEPRLVVEPLRGPLFRFTVVRVEGGRTYTVNAVASIGDDGVLLVDTLSPQWVDLLIARLGSLSRLPVRAIVNTHAHVDHMGGNAAVVDFARRSWPRVGAPAIIAHRNVARRVAEGGGVPGADGSLGTLSAAGRPSATFTTTRRLRFNGEDVRITHVPNAHSDGDSVVHFTGSGVAAVGDLFYVDGGSVAAGVSPGEGGSLGGLIRGAREVADSLPPSTVIVPGHGPVRTVAELRAYAALLEGVLAYVRAGTSGGRSLDDLVRAGLPDEVRSLAGAGWTIAQRELIEAAHAAVSGGASY